MVPKGWQKREVGENITFSGGAQPPRDQFISEAEEGYIRLIQIRDYKSDKYATYIPKRLARKFCSTDDVMIGRYGPPIFQILRGIEGAYNVALIKAIPNTGVDRDFMFYFLKREALLRYIESFQQRTSGQTGIEMDMLKAYPMPLPPFPEQKKIAQILSTWDQAIIGTERLLENSRQRKKWVMQQLLTGKKRLPGFEGEFNTLTLNQAANITMGTSPKSAAYNSEGNGLPLLQGNADIDGRRSNPRVFTSEVTRVCQPGNILLSVRAPVGSVAISDHEACIGRGICAIEARGGNDQSFLYHWMLWYEPRWSSLSQGSTFESVNSTDIKNLRIKLPSIGEQRAISEILSVADQECDFLMTRLSHLKQEKKALMQQLLTGKRRVELEAA